MRVLQKNCRLTRPRWDVHKPMNHDMPLDSSRQSCADGNNALLTWGSLPVGYFVAVPTERQRLRSDTPLALRLAHL